MARLFSESRLLFEKGDERHSADRRTYAEKTIERAIDRACEVYELGEAAGGVGMRQGGMAGIGTDSGLEVDYVARISALERELRRVLDEKEALEDVLGQRGRNASNSRRNSNRSGTAGFRCSASPARSCCWTCLLYRCYIFSRNSAILETDRSFRRYSEWYFRSDRYAFRIAFQIDAASLRWFVDATCCGVDAFGERRMDVHCLGDIVSCRPEFDRQYQLVNDFSALFPHDVGA